MRRALHLGVQKAHGVVSSHYQVDLEAVSTGYVVPIGVDDEVAMNRVDALASPAADVLAEDFMDFLFPDAPPTGGPPSLKTTGCLCPLCFCVSVWATRPRTKHLLFKTFGYL
jgi:hypothetical protein